jgi:hypothetical protein
LSRKAIMNSSGAISMMSRSGASRPSFLNKSHASRPRSSEPQPVQAALWRLLKSLNVVPLQIGQERVFHLAILSGCR